MRILAFVCLFLSPLILADERLSGQSAVDQMAATQSLIKAALNLPEVQRLLKKNEKQSLRMRKQEEHIREFATDFRISVPEGAGFAFSYTPDFPISTEVQLGSSGATAGISAGVTYIFSRNKKFSPTITLKFGRIQFTEYADALLSRYLPDWSQEQVTVKMSGRWLNEGSLMGGIDWVSPSSGIHLVARFGVLRQIGESGGGEESNGKLKFSNWVLPAVDLGMGVAF
jgi:hypothetical protein